MSLRQFLEQGSGFAGQIHPVNDWNTQYTHDNQFFNITALTGLVLGIGVATSFSVQGFIPAFAIVSLIGFVFGSGIICAGVYQNKQLFFARSASEKEFELRAFTIITAPIVSIFFAAEQILKYLGHVIKAIGCLVMLDYGNYKEEMSRAGDAFLKIYSNLAAVIFNPILNFFDLIGSLITPNEVQVAP